MATMSSADTATNEISHQVGVRNSSDRAVTVARSVTNVADSRSCPTADPDSPISTTTA